ncbi:hypothetical protein L249_7655 [Ophiocordyceps polyrhachis-furcata BCC 54312]|uniref:C2H2-type domain-containing protein n=1 Tax=Ophiocordyceps polyrhachis-furcata BCC 54312 TaxID=1330021 RepID=A0A367LB24_9HYPO|nr:hypothetical protein L249_7655 [Ophiocordyceps polyrhachis-furcata BCC 54312]
MSSDAENDVFHCRPCNMAFYSWEALLKHKADMRSAGRPSHIHCKHCGQDFKTGLSEMQHIQQFHPQEQNLVCRACGMGPFARASGLIGHIEQGQCSRLTMDDIEEQREKKSEFARCLQAVSGSPVRNDFSKYMGGFSTASSGAGGGSTVAEEEHQVDKLLMPVFEQKQQRDEPVIAGLADKAVVEQQQAERPLVAGLVDKPVVQNQQQQLPLASTGQQPVKVFESMDRDHPDHPSFNSRRYYNSYAQAYVCPKLSCTKVFNRAGGLMAHLRSLAHAEKKYHCPYCNRRFPTMTAIVAHAEQSSARCHIRESDNYEAFMDQLTGGVIDVGLDRHEDGTVRYDMGNVEW